MKESIFIADTAKILGDVTLGKDTSVWFNAVIRTEKGKIDIGEGTNIQDNCILHADDELSIGNNVTIGHGAIVHCSRIGDNTLVGMGAILLDGARIGNNCIIAAGAVVKENEEIPDNSLVVGIPGKVIKKISTEEANKCHACRYKALGSKYSAGEYGKA